MGKKEETREDRSLSAINIVQGKLEQAICDEEMIQTMILRGTRDQMLDLHLEEFGETPVFGQVEGKWRAR